ncbi:AMP-binding protein [Actinophytocola sp.]|uniref:AMP-binding protein n=1 Tax=Actinophytocola sp. TaxID=1872138 RepID=UPI002D363FEC|nr:AMP-binding protein [Actinophytocola sp.]HYQ62466.1 AMP-binding protein [Actinophytocola sp.]
MSVAAALRAAGEVAGTRAAVVQGDRRISHAELHVRASRVAGTLAARGVGQGDVVAVGLHNSPEYLETVLAAFVLGAVPVNINYRYREPELRYVLEYTDAVAVVHDDALADRLANVTGELPGLKAVLGVGPATAGSYDEAATTGPARVLSGADSPHGIILLTGGTTGRPKGVIWDRDGLLGILCSVFRQRGLPAPATPAEVRAAVAALAERDVTPVVLPMSPLMHGTGFFHAVRTLLGGGTVCFATSRSLDGHEVWQAVQDHRITDMVIVGDAFGRPLVAALAEAERSGRPYDISSLARMNSSGVIWSVDVKRALLERGSMTLVDQISASEGGPFGVAEARTAADLADGRFALASVARVLDEDDQDVRPGSGQVGVLASSGPQPVGYLKDPERTARTWRVIDGVRYAVPGDLASLDADGKLVLLGRGDGVINTGGEKVFPEEVEQALLAHPAITDAVVFGTPDPRWGATVTAMVAPAGALSGITDDELTAHLDGQLARYKHPRRLVRTDTIPRTPAGKLNRSLAREIAAQEAAR